MTIYKLTRDAINKVQSTTFAAAGINERGDLQRLLRDQIEIISPDTMVVAEEFGEWEDSRRRIDLLGIDKAANLVVIELKRTEDGGHMELQAIRYAAMVSMMTFERVIEVYERYLEARSDERDARRTLLNFLGWEEPDQEHFGKETRIVLASAEFSKELTTAVLFLRDHDLDIRCVRIKPYGEPANLLIDVGQMIPLPEAEDYITGVRAKQQQERLARRPSRDLTRFDVTVNGEVLCNLPKRRAALAVIRALGASGVSPQDITQTLDWRNNLFLSVEGELDSKALISQLGRVGSTARPRKYFVADAELIQFGGKTYALTNIWGPRTERAIRELSEQFHPANISFTKSNR